MAATSIFFSSGGRYLWQAAGRSARGDISSSFSSPPSHIIRGGLLRQRRRHSTSLTKSSFENDGRRRRFSTTPPPRDDGDDDDDGQSQRASRSRRIHVWEQTISSYSASASYDSADVDGGRDMPSGGGRVLYTPAFDRHGRRDAIGWEVHANAAKSKTNERSSRHRKVTSLINSYENGDFSIIVRDLPFVHHFLPAGHPHSVCPSYSSYASYCFLGSIAASSAMVLSTQALLIAVGVGTQSAAPMAAALNWVMKDGVGQLGGVIFASQLGRGGIDVDRWRGKLSFGKWSLAAGGGGRKSRRRRRGNYQRGTADSNPKRWRMVAALALDMSTLLEICTPMLGPQWFLPCASIANIGKNVGYLAASASRATIHQSLSTGGGSSSSISNVSEPEVACAVYTPVVSSNLGDITAKSGSQSIVASLLGTAIGIFLSRAFCSDHGTAGILAGFAVLSAIHQVCTYKAVKCVPLRSLDRHRLHIVLSSYITENLGRDSHNFGDPSDGVHIIMTTLTPAQVAEKETFLPMMPPDDSVEWLIVGDSLVDICPSGVSELERLLLVRHLTDDDRSNESSDIEYDSKDYEKYILKIGSADDGGMVQLTYLVGATDNDILRGMFHSYVAHSFIQSNDSYHTGRSNERMGLKILTDTHNIMARQMPMFLKSLQIAGWQIGTGFVTVECGSSHRLMLKNA